MFTQKRCQQDNTFHDKRERVSIDLSTHVIFYLTFLSIRPHSKIYSLVFTINGNIEAVNAILGY